MRSEFWKREIAKYKCQLVKFMYKELTYQIQVIAIR